MRVDRNDGSVRGLGRRVLWFAVLWIGGVVAVGIAALLIRSVLL